MAPYVLDPSLTSKMFNTQPATSDGCGLSDSIGMSGGKQQIWVSLDPSCATLGTFTHEMGHAVGFEQEQTRTDRDYYVTIHFENLDKNEAGNYDPDPGQIDVLPYNQGSIMHYAEADFHRNTLNTMDTIPPGIPIAHRNNLSPGDIEAVRTIYGSPSSSTTIYTTPGSLSVIVDGQIVKTPMTFNWAAGTRHTLDVPSGYQQIGASTGTRYSFARWSNDGPQSETITASPQTRIIASNFAAQFRVQSGVGSSGGGAVSLSPASPDGFYTSGTVLTIAATPASGYAFLQWDNPYSISANTSTTPASNWQQKWLVSTYLSDPANPYGSNNGKITVSPASSDCNNPTPTDCYYPAGTKLTFTPASVSPFAFTGWSGDLDGNITPASITLSDQVFLTANFQNSGRLVRAAIVNAANYEAQGVAPGEIVTIFGLQFGPPQQLPGAQLVGNRLATTLAQTQVLFDGVAAPLVYVSANQLSAIVPYAVAGKATTRITVSYQGKQGNAINVNVLPTHAGLFSADSSGSGLVAALNQNNSVHSLNNPATRGSVIQLFGTGMGVTNPGSVDGQIVSPSLSGPVLPFQVTIAGRIAQVPYFGGAPGLVTGVFQAKVVIPADCRLVPISVTVGNSQSPATTRIAAQ